MPGVSPAARAKSLKTAPEPTITNTTPELIKSLQDKNKRGEKLSLDEMIIWNAAKLNGWAYCTKHKKKYRFHQGCQSCNDTCIYCGKVVPDNAAPRHHETCTDMPKKIKKQISKKMAKNISLGKELVRLLAIPQEKRSMQIIDKIRSIRQQMVKL